MTEHPAHLLHADSNPRDDFYINIDMRVIGKSVLVGHIQIL